MINNFDVRSEILAAVSATNDQIHRSFLLLMLGVLDRLDSVLADDASLRKQVLNGHEPNHHGDHDFVQVLRREDALAACEWVKVQMVREQAALETKKSFFKEFLKGLAGQFALIIVTVIGTAVGLSQWIK